MALNDNGLESQLPDVLRLRAVISTCSPTLRVIEAHDILIAHLAHSLGQNRKTLRHIFLKQLVLNAAVVAINGHAYPTTGQFIVVI